MIAELSGVFSGPFAELGEVLSIEGKPELPLGQFLASSSFPRTLARFSERWPNPEPRAVATQWSKIYFARLLPAVLLPAFTLNWHLPLAAETMGLRLTADGAVKGFELPYPGEVGPAPETPFDRFDFLVDSHLRPVIEMLAAATPLPQKVLWSNAGNVFENIVTRASAMLGAKHPAIGDASAMMAARRRPDDRANPLFEPVRYVERDGEHLRQRRICCLRYFIDSLGYCKSCPLSD